MNKLIRIALTFLLVMTTGVIQAEIVIYPVPQGIYYARHNDDYTVKVRQVGEKDWVDLYEYNVKVDMDTKSDATMVQFDFSGKVEVLVQKNNGEIRSAVVRPLSKGIQPEIDGNFLLFTIDKPQKLSVEFNGDRLNNLHVFANPIIKNVPDKNDPNVIYFEAGIHEPTDTAGKCFRIPSNTTVYLEGGAVLKGCLTCDSVENVKILGHGMLLEPQQGISVTYSRNVLIDGVTVVNWKSLIRLHITVSPIIKTGYINHCRKPVGKHASYLVHTASNGACRVFAMANILQERSHFVALGTTLGRNLISYTPHYHTRIVPIMMQHVYHILFCPFVEIAVITILTFGNIPVL